MKKLIVFLLIGISVCVSAQKYVPFPTENAEWNVFYAYSYHGEPMDTTLLQYSLQGDTTISGLIYRKVCRNIGSQIEPIYKGVGGLREQDKKVYYFGLSYAEKFETIFNNEIILYDFNKQIGDTVWFDSHMGLNYIIAKIDSVKIGNEYRKRYNDCIIDGIGDVISVCL